MTGDGQRRVEGFPLGAWQANCYLIGQRSCGRVVVVDPGEGGAEAVRARLDALDVTCEAVLLTHGHLDHLWSAPQLAAELGVEVFLHPDDRWLWDNPAAAFGGMPAAALAEQFGLRWAPADECLRPLADGEDLALAGLRLRVRHTPGHTPGSCVFLLDDGDPLLLSGDLLFAGSVGRTDLVRGSWGQQRTSLERVVLPLDDATVVLSGHGRATTIGAERRSNPYLKELA